MYSNRCYGNNCNSNSYIYGISGSYSNSLEDRVYNASAKLIYEEPSLPPAYTAFGATSSTGAESAHTYIHVQQSHNSYSAKNRKDNDSMPASRTTVSYVFSPEMFLRPIRPATQFVDSTEIIREAVLEAFSHTTGSSFPEDVTIRVCSREEMKTRHAEWHEGILGFSVNRLGFGTSEVFLLENDMDVLLLTAGHEIGHVLSFPARSRLAEEVKAFAFEAAWLQSIFTHNIAGLKNSISFAAFSPANNGLHDKAFEIVKKQLIEGKKPLQVYSELSGGKLISE